MGRCDACRCTKFHVHNWMKVLPQSDLALLVVEVRFKNSRKDFFFNDGALRLDEGDLVVVSASGGYDMGEVTLTGELVMRQMRSQNIPIDAERLPKVLRFAEEQDLRKWEEVKSKEHETLLKAREYAVSLGLNMKIGDVEYQGDGTKATFYYIAEERVDFRELIKIYGAHFRIRVEMRQIGVRQETGRIGGIGSCGRELCCSSWRRHFASVPTSLARLQDPTINMGERAPEKCGKLKCCFSFEEANYVNSDTPSSKIKLKTTDGEAIFQKMDIFQKVAHYLFYKKGKKVESLTLSFKRANEVVRLNKQGIFPKQLQEEGKTGVSTVKEQSSDSISVLN